jgi:hypothetical protein
MPKSLQVFNKAICGAGFQGIFLIWIAQFLTSGLLFFTTCYASILFAKFGHYSVHIDDNDFENNDPAYELPKPHYDELEMEKA